MIQKKWKLIEAGEDRIKAKLAKDLNLHPILANLLVQRGIDSYDKARVFFRPAISDLHDPFLMSGMDQAVARIGQAIQAKENILVYGDYDVDGTTAVALVYSFLSKYHPRLAYYIPDRYNEGYGVSYQSIDFASDNDIALVITLDCGIKAIDKIQYAKEKGIDYIVCDHHQPQDQLPAAVAVLNPKRPDCPYPFKELSGCGIGYKLICALAQSMGIPLQETEQYLDLVATSIAADIVPITGENRILSYHGLEKINQSPSIGFEAILKCAGVEREAGRAETVFSRKIDVNQLVFQIAPRINAAGRIEDARRSVELLLTGDREQAMALAKSIDNNNNDRRGLDKKITEQALQIISQDPDRLSRKTTVVYHPDWHKGVVGIVASRLTESYYRPTIVLSLSNGLVSGSARSVKHFDLYKSLEACADLLENFGGHKYAAGLSMKPENLEPFKARFEEQVSLLIEDDMLIPEQVIDAELDFRFINERFLNVIKQFAPFGPGNYSPVFQTNLVLDKGQARIVGDNHLKLTIKQASADNQYLDCIAFNQGHQQKRVKRGDIFNICYHIEENEWNGGKSIQLRIKDMQYPS